MDRKELADKNLGLIVKVIKKHFKYRSSNIEFQDLFNSGYIGLRKAAELFDPNMGTKFSTFAYHCIRGSIQRFMHQTNIIVVGQSAISHMKKKKNEDELRKLKNIMKKNYISLDVILKSSDKPITWTDSLVDESSGKEIERIENESEYNYLMDNIEKLGIDEKAVIYLRYGIIDKNPRTLEEVGNIIGITRERIRQIEEIALNKLKKIYELEIKK